MFSWISPLNVFGLFSLKLYESTLFMIYHMFTPHIDYATLQFDILGLFEPHFRAKYSNQCCMFLLQTDPQDFTSHFIMTSFSITRYVVYFRQRGRAFLRHSFPIDLFSKWWRSMDTLQCPCYILHFIAIKRTEQLEAAWRTCWMI